jgi:hypothetical protein
VTNRIKLRAAIFVAAPAAVATFCLGCGSSSGESGGPPPSGNRPPTISGDPPTNLGVDQLYEFTPTATDADGDDLVFSIENLPEWANFDPGTGRLQGRPGAADVGQFTGIIISVSDGTASDSLPQFSISVDEIAAGRVSLAWTPPLTNADGSTITDLAGYRIYYGRDAAELDELVVIDNPGISRWVIEGLQPATWHFTMTSINEAGLESARTPVLSREVS